MSKPSLEQVVENSQLLNHSDYWGFCDWFCKDTSLEKRAKSFIPKLKFLVNNNMLPADKAYVWFKNNCPMRGTLYDDMRFSSTNKDNDYIGGICPRTGHVQVKDKCEAWGFGEDGKLVEFKFPSWREFKKAVKDNTEQIQELKKLWNNNVQHF